jgi:Fic family protein
MMSFRGDRLARTPLPPAAVWLIGDVMEHRGRQALHARQAPAALKALRELAMVQSVESSNRIEGVTVSPSRLRPLVLGRAKPQNRPEEEVRNYREALALVYRDFAKLEVMPATVQRLHAICQAGSDDAGRWKQRNNQIVEIVPGEAPRVRFTPLAAAETPAAVAELCRLYGGTVPDEQVPPLVAVAAFVFDFLCIHPFRDGNGRVSRLLTLLLLHRHGFEVGRYVSLDRIVEDDRARYYEVLRQSSVEWHDGRHTLDPWLIFLLGVLRSAGREFEARVGAVKAPRGAKTLAVEQVIAEMEGPFSLVDLERRCPHVSRDMVRLLLFRLRRAGRVECTGRGPLAAWRRTGRWPERM